MTEPLSNIAKNVCKLPAAERTIDNLIYWIFHKPNQKIELLRLENSAELDRHEEALKQGAQNIPEEYKMPPMRCITARALEESLNYVDQEDLIKIFQNIILSSVDSRYAKHNHPAFIGIVLQLSPLDARNLKLFKKHPDYPLVDYVYSKSTSYTVFQPDVFLENPDEQDIELQSISIRNLARLGLVNTPDKQITTPDEPHLCEKYEKNQMFLEHVNKLKSGQLPSDVISVDALCGSVSLTPFGQSFIDTCIR